MMCLARLKAAQGTALITKPLFDGARILVVADTDILANNKIYQVKFITHNGRRQIHLKPTIDTESNLGEGVLIRRGEKIKD
jgi:hypothetical protein